MLPELNQEDIETAESVHCKSWVLRKLESGRVGCFNWNEEMCLGLQIVEELPKVYCSRQHRFVTSQHGYAKTHL